MKTKIIYISGREVFDMADIRAAFEEVRTALHMGDDTILFGVPVDEEDALGQEKSIPVVEETLPTIEEIATPTEEKEEVEIIQTPQIEISQDVPAMEAIEIEPVAAHTPIEETPIEPSITNDEVATEEEKPVLKKTPGRRRTTKKAIKDTTNAAAAPEAPVVDDDNVTISDAPVVPILSVLATGAPNTPDVVDETPEIDEPVQTIEIDPAPEATPIIADEEIHGPFGDAPIETVTIEDMIADDAPMPEREKTLEELLESMTPLREDHIGEEEFEAPELSGETDESNATDTDATLARLATEFAENQDKIVPLTKTETHGKIGKLKNILPFKKVKRDDSGLMGDLFGWAGIAANDEEFSMPGFFTNAAGKQ